MDPTSVTTWPCSDPVGWCSVRGYKLNQPPKAMGLTTQRKESPSSMAGTDEKVFPAPWFFETAQASSPMTHSWAEAYPHCCCTSSFGICARKDIKKGYGSLCSSQLCMSLEFSPAWGGPSLSRLHSPYHGSYQAHFLMSSRIHGRSQQHLMLGVISDISEPFSER